MEKESFEEKFKIFLLLSMVRDISSPGKGKIKEIVRASASRVTEGHLLKASICSGFQSLARIKDHDISEASGTTKSDWICSL